MRRPALFSFLIGGGRNAERGSYRQASPQNLQAEESVLGAVIFDHEAFPKAVELVGDEDFYKESHRRIYRAMLDLFERNEPIDIITLTDALKRNGDLDAVGGIQYLTYLATVFPPRQISAITRS